MSSWRHLAAIAGAVAGPPSVDALDGGWVLTFDDGGRTVLEPT